MRVSDFRRTVFRSYKKHGRRALPWRKTQNTYRIFVSEIMLQQTQVSRILPKYNEWMKVFPDWRALERAPFAKVLGVWQGIGYNRRARFLKESAKIVAAAYRGALPASVSELERFPGIGPYSARAIACFAFDRCEPFIETNIRRAVIHSFFSRKRAYISDAEILVILRRVEPRAEKREWYWALMDFGASLSHLRINPNRRAESYRAQSRFEGSSRYVRAAVLKALLEKRRLSLRELKRILMGDPHAASYLRGAGFMQILVSLEKDKILWYNNKQWKIAENK